MYNKEYLRWCEAVGEEYLQAELKEINGNDEAIKERFLDNPSLVYTGLVDLLTSDK